MLSDASGRKIEYLRLSLTSECPLRCIYCRPGPAGERPQDDHPLRPVEIESLVRYLAERHGLHKVRLTGGDPTSRPDLTEIIERIAAIPGIHDLSMTTHGLTLARKAREYKKAGLHRVNVSLDTLDVKQFQRITGSDGLERVLAGIHAAQEFALHPVRINTVVVRGENDDQLVALLQFAARHILEIRFIELMPMGPLAASWHDRAVSESQMRERLAPIVQSWHALPRKSDSAQRYRVILDDGTMVCVGFISAMTGCFCEDCNRIRVTSDGSIYPCLMDRPRGNLMSALRPRFEPDQLEAALATALSGKQLRHPAAGVAVMTQIGG
ncbi:MAG TPA: GTP 3',8-cyclase MoaA [Phycisphaerae bacterium]|nr:GTP 3',8-cyclase MoaA [Phycisphaerae bacterium]HOM53482.1 GTP 3',8-cyclase MoaA [Phycisphaerae bacterium]HON66848.1 GTP 3',8-cyclase MoaA [Phycisphaerae bacterium]HOQ86512.1 GTP 3',8-cyclase MoaA [Phycisphaerae bacterium]HPP27500.1 GTP 3',8-cyclase MoaA [Phycisphaerae bacterium]